MKETEITVEVLEPKQSLTDKLTSYGFIQNCEFTMLDRYYSPKSIQQLNGRSFESVIRNSFLLRTIIKKQENDDEEVNILIYKDKLFNEKGDVIAEEKVQTYIDNAEKHAEIFQKAGFVPYATIKSSNLVYKKGDIEFVVQDVDGVGLFIEFEEYESISHLSPEEKIETLKNTLLQFDLSLGTNFSCKKLELYLKQINQKQSK